MIPKIIHYCWFGKNEIPESTKKYMVNWKKMCPDFQIKQWNEDNFDINSCSFVKEAYEKKKWAFVSDYVRFWAMYNEGGVYIETDAEILRPIDELLKHGAFFGLAGDDTTLSLCGMKKHHPVGEKIIDLYQVKHFIKEDGDLNLKTINRELFDVLTHHFDLKHVNQFQIIKDNIAIYPDKFFYSFDYITGITKLNDELYVRHYGDGSWLDEKTKRRLSLQHKYVRKFGARIGIIVGKIIFYFTEEGMISMLNHSVKYVTRKMF